MTSAPLPPDPRTIFHSEFPDRLLLAICRQVWEAYKSAWLFCDGDYPPEQRHDLYPVLRRSNIERDINHILRQFPSASASIEPNSIGAAYHSVVRSGRVILTVSAISERGEKPRDARFRQKYAKASLQRLLFDSNDDALADDGSDLYAVLLHGQAEKHPQLPAFMDVAFPDATCAGYYDRIDLFARFPQIGEWIRPTAEKIITPAARLKRVKRPEEAE